MLPLTATRLRRDGDRIVAEPAGDLVALVRAHLSRASGGLVVLGRFGSGKSTLCRLVARDRDDATVVPLRDVAEHPTVEAGLRATIGAARLAEARAGDRILLLDGLDEVPDPGPGGFPGFFDDLVALAGPRWLVTSRPGHVRTEIPFAPDQVDVFARAGVDLVEIDPLAPDVARAAVGALDGGERLWRSVEGLADLAASPLILQVIHAAARYIDPGRPIQAWGVFDAWLRHALSTGPGHDEALQALEDLAWDAFSSGGWRHRAPAFDRARLRAAALPPSLRNALLVSDLDGRHRFGHRAVYEFLLASHIAPRLLANQGHGPDALTGLGLTDATRGFLVGRAGPMPVERRGDRVRIPRGNFVAGGEIGLDERPLRIAHLPRPVWIARAPVTHAEWAAFLRAVPDDRIDANYLPHWGPERRLPAHLADAPVYGISPDDADRYARWAGACLPTADAWEKAVRGCDGRRYPWGDFWRPGLAATAEMGLDHPLPVRALGAHGDAGLFSAAGGVFEITASWWRDRPDRGRVVMGGCTTHDAATARASLRLSHRLSGHLKMGTRLAWSDP